MNSLPPWALEAVKGLPPLVPEETFAEFMHVGARTARRWRAAGKIKAIRTSADGGGRILYAREAVAQFLASLEGRAA